MVKVMGTNTSSEDQFWLTVCGDDFGTFWSSFYKLNNRKRLANHPKQFADVVQPSGDSCHNNLSTRIRGDETPKETNMEPTKLVVCRHFFLFTTRHFPAVIFVFKGQCTPRKTNMSPAKIVFRRILSF